MPSSVTLRGEGSERVGLVVLMRKDEKRDGAACRVGGVGSDPVRLVETGDTVLYWCVQACFVGLKSS